MVEDEIVSIGKNTGLEKIEDEESRMPSTREASPEPLYNPGTYKPLYEPLYHPLYDRADTRSHLRVSLCLVQLQVRADVFPTSIFSNFFLAFLKSLSEKMNNFRCEMSGNLNV